jgi:hypothetical protein
MAARMPDARLEVVPDAGHTVHLEQPAAYERAILEFFEKVGNRNADGADSKDDADGGSADAGGSRHAGGASSE